MNFKTKHENYVVGDWVAFRFAQKKAGVEIQKLFDFYG